MSTLPAMPKLLLVTVPTDEVLNKEGKVRFPGTEAAVQQLTALLGHEDASVVKYARSAQEVRGGWR